jgi:hypothetical protein
MGAVLATLTAFYDLQYGPVSFDFVTWLVHAKHRAGDRKLHVVIVPHETGLGGFARHWGKHDEYAARWRLWHIAVASCPLVDATVTVAHSREQAESLKREPFWWDAGKQHFMFPLVDAFRNGSIPKLKPTMQAVRYICSAMMGKRPFVTLTVRNQSTDPTRNSRIEEWKKLAEHLKQKWHVVWLDDANEALSQGRGYAELDPDLRLALYEQSAMNFIGNNGPSVMLQLSNAPYRVFLDKGWPEHWKTYFHMEHGEQFPWANEFQKLVFKPDTFENMRASWDLATS